MKDNNAARKWGPTWIVVKERIKYARTSSGNVLMQKDHDQENPRGPETREVKPESSWLLPGATRHKYTSTHDL